MRIALAVAGGGALGAAARYLMAGAIGQWLAGGFPFATLAVNLLGCFAMGAFIEVTALVWSPSPELRAMIVVGLLGGFTTFSTYSMEVVALVERGAPVPAAIYMVASVLLSLIGIFGGMRIFRVLLT